MRNYVLPALLLLSGTSAQACEIWRDPELGIWRGNCNITEDFRNRFVLAKQAFLENYEHRILLRSPDLHIRKFKFFVSGTSITARERRHRERGQQPAGLGPGAARDRRSADHGAAGPRRDRRIRRDQQQQEPRLSLVRADARHLDATLQLKERSWPVMC